MSTRIGPRKNPVRRPPQAGGNSVVSIFAPITRLARRLTELPAAPQPLFEAAAWPVNARIPMQATRRSA